jgi:hypothetical protein
MAKVLEGVGVMVASTHGVSVKGRIREVPAFPFGQIVVVTRGRLLRIAEVFDEYWLPADVLPDPDEVVRALRTREQPPDLFTFAQRVPDTEPRYSFTTEWDNVAVIPLTSYDAWFSNQISSASRRNIRASSKKGVVVKAVPFDDEYVRGIKAIYDESPIRGGRQFWHFGKDLAKVEAENGTYRDRSTFLAAYCEGEMIGYMKIVWDTRTAAIMQILSKVKFRDRRPNNAMLSEAVRLCVDRRISYLLYEKYVYGSNADSSLTRFKRENGFVRMDLPRYYVPLTVKGALLLRLGLHGDPKDIIPGPLRAKLVSLRDRWYARRTPDE